MKNTLIKFLAFAFIVVGCTSGKVDSNKNSDPLKKYQEVAQKKFKKDIEYSKSPNGDYVLCIKDIKGSAQQPMNNLSFFVYDVKKDKITFELKVGAGTVKWLDKKTVEVYRTPGALPQGYNQDNYTTYYNVIDGTSRPKK